MVRTPLVAFLAIALASLAQAAQPADNSLIVGVFGNDGFGVTGAKVTVSGAGSGASTDTNGQARFNALSAGTYQVQVEASGYNPAIRQAEIQGEGHPSGRLIPMLHELETKTPKLGAVQLTHDQVSNLISEASAAATQ